MVGQTHVRDLEKRVRELERLLGKKTREVETLKEALEVTRTKKPMSLLPSWQGRRSGSR